MAQFLNKNALDQEQLKKWCEKNHLPFNSTTLQELNQKGKTNGRFSFIFTGDNEDEFNKGAHNHWLACDGKHVFDSYGRKNGYKFPAHYEVWPNSPNQLQEFNSKVCGEYCCAFLYYCHNEPSDSETDQSDNEGKESSDSDTEKGTDKGRKKFADGFSDEFGFTTSRANNDRTVLEWFKQRNQQA